MGKKAAKPAAKKEVKPAATIDASASPAPAISTEAPAPAVEAPAAPNVDAPVAPNIEAPAAPSVEAPAAPNVEAPAAPNVEAPAAPNVEAPVVPAVDAHVAPAVEAPAEPNVEAPAPPADETPAVPTEDHVEPVPQQTTLGIPGTPTSEGQMIGESGLPIDVDDDEVLDEIKPRTPGGSNKPSPEQYKKDFTKNQIEAVLFVSGQAVSAEEVSVKLNVGKKIVEEMLDKLAMEYLERTSALEIAKIADKYILQLKPEFTSSVKSFATGGLIREAVMRTLTIIAAKQPILQSDLSKIRSSAGEHLKELGEMGLVKGVPKGRSKELTTTDKFADMFGFSRDVNQMKEQIKIYLTAATKDDAE